MKIDLNKQQLALLKDVLAEYSQECYDSFLEYQHVVTDAEEDFIRREYASYAAAEEKQFNDTRALLDYIQRYEALMQGHDD